MKVRAFILVALATSLFPASASALPSSSSYSVESSARVSSGGGGGAGNIFINDVQNIESRRLTFSIGETRDFFQRRIVNARSSCSGGVCEGPARRYGASTSGSPGGAVGGYGDLQAAGEDGLSRMMSQVGLANKCAVYDGGRRGTGSNCFKHNAFSEIHPLTPADPRNGEQGVATHALVRIWRECRVGFKAAKAGAKYDVRVDRYDTADSGSPGVNASVSASSCTVDPILERIVAVDEGPETPANFFFVRRDGDGAVKSSASDDYGAIAARAQKTVAGPLFGSCLSESSRAARKLCADTSSYSDSAAGSAATQLQQRCSAAGLPSGQVNWTDAEMLAEITQRGKDGDRRFTGSRGAAVREWVLARATGKASALPPGFSAAQQNSAAGRAARAALCKALSEWHALTWSIPRSGKGGNARVSTTANIIPGRTYVEQVVILDARENILAQSLRRVASRSTPVPTCTAKNGARYPVGDARCAGDPPAWCVIEGHEQEGIPVGDPRCLEGRRPAPVASLGKTGSIDFTGPAASGNGTNGTYVLTVKDAPADEGQAPTGGALDKDASLWTPRALAFSVFDYAIAKRSSSLSAARKNYRDSTRAQVVDAPSAFAGAANNGPLLNTDATEGAIAQTVTDAGGFTFTGTAPVTSSTGQGAYTSTLRVASQNATRQTKAKDPAAQARAASVRTATVLGENRFLQSTGEEYDPALPKVNADAKPRLRRHALTMDRCTSGSGMDAPPATLILPNGHQSSCDPDAPLTGGPNPFWRVKDAYVAQPKEPSAPDYELVSLMRQDADGPASVRLNSALARSGNVKAIEVWSAGAWANRASGEETPDYRVTASDVLAQQSAASGRAHITFCAGTIPNPAATRKTTYVDPPGGPLTLDHYRASWGGFVDPNGTDPDAPDNGVLGPTSLSNFNVLTGGGVDAGVRAFLNNDRFQGLYVDALGQGIEGDDVPLDPFTFGLAPTPGTQIWGRSWWFSSQDVGWERAQAVRNGVPGARRLKLVVPQVADTGVPATIANPDCPTGTVAREVDDSGADSSTPATRLPQGNWVVRFIIGGSVSRPEPYGIEADLMTNPTRQWAVRFNALQRSVFTDIFTARTTG